MKNSHNASVHIKIVSAFYFLVSALLLLSAIAYMAASGWIKATFIDNPHIQEMDSNSFVMWGFVLLLIAALEGFLGLKLYQQSKMARIIAIIISALGFCWAAVGLVYFKGMENIFFLGIHGYFIWSLKYKYSIR